MRVRLVPFGPGTAADSIRCLTEAEAATYGGLKAEKRRIEWLAGRLAAKNLVLAHLRESGHPAIGASRAPETQAAVDPGTWGHGDPAAGPADVEIAREPSGAPVALLRQPGKPGFFALELCVSISHRMAGDDGRKAIHDGGHPASGCNQAWLPGWSSGLVGVALADHPSRIGVDVEWVEERHPAFLRDYFSPEERDWMQGDPFRVTLGWSAKEAVLKALRTGLALDPLAVGVGCPAHHGLAVDGSGAERQPLLAGAVEPPFGQGSTSLPVTVDGWTGLPVTVVGHGGSTQAWYRRQGGYVAVVALRGGKLEDTVCCQPRRAGGTGCKDLHAARAEACRGGLPG